MSRSLRRTEQDSTVVNSAIRQIQSQLAGGESLDGDIDLVGTITVESGGASVVGQVLFTAEDNTDIIPAIQELGAGASSSSLGIARYSASATPPRILFGKSRSAALDGYTVVQADDDLGSIVWSGADGTNFCVAAMVRAEVDGTPGNNDMPGRLVLSTTADAGATPTDRWVVDALGALKPASNNAVDIGTSALAVKSVHSNSIEFNEITAPASPAANKASLFVQDNGAGKTQLCVLFPTGVVTVIATEP